MSEPKFTKGPWKATYDSQLQAAIEIYNTEDRILVAVLPDRGTVEAMPEIEANANLIADAWQLPDLRREIAELKAINKEMCEALEAIAVKLDMMRPINPFEYGEIRDEIINDIKVLHKTRGEINNDQS